MAHPVVSTCSPSNPLRLWSLFRRDLSEDILLRQRRESNRPDLDFCDSTYNEALILIEDLCLPGKPSECYRIFGVFLSRLFFPDSGEFENTIRLPVFRPLFAINGG